MSLDALLQKAISQAADSINVAEMAIVTAVTDNTKVDCQPLVKKWFMNGDIEDLPIIADVPLQFSGSDNAKIEFEISVGDYVLLIMSNRDITTIKNSLPTKPVEPDSPRMHNLSDAFAIPISSSDSGTGHIYINASGKMSFTNDGAELLTIIDNLMAALVVLGNTPTPVPPAVISLPFANAVDLLKTALGSLKI